MEMPGHVASVAPGMTQVIVAGESYTLKDDHGAELELVGRDRPWVIEFLTAMDNYMDAAGRLGDSHEHVQPFAKKVRELWLSMPEDLARKMPSISERGVRIDITHDH
jgi:hypothetical protein